MARSNYSALILATVLLLSAVGAWGDVSTPGQSTILPGQGPGAPGIFAQPFGPNQAGSIPVAPLPPEPGISPIAPEPVPPPTPPTQQPGQVPDDRLPTGTSCAGGLNATPGFLCPEPGTLPGSIPSTSNSNMFVGKESSPTNPGASGTIPGQSNSSMGTQGTPLRVEPPKPQGFMTPQR